MLSKQEIQIIRSLGIKKYRQKYLKYLAEGEKICLEIIHASTELIDTLYCLEDFHVRHVAILENKAINYSVISKKELQKISQLKHPNNSLIVLNMPESGLNQETKNCNNILYLDDISDPGNLGTIMRTVEWFGVDLLLLSPNCVDPYNPKVVQSSMGSLFRIRFSIVELNHFLNNQERDFNVYIADMNGKNAFQTEFKNPSILVLGNESQGVQLKLNDQASEVISVPSAGSPTESLNVSIAGAILLAEMYKKNG